MDPILIGYFPRRQDQAPRAGAASGVPNVTEIASVAHYTSDGPANWIEQ